MWTFQCYHSDRLRMVNWSTIARRIYTHYLSLNIANFLEFKRNLILPLKKNSLFLIWLDFFGYGLLFWIWFNSLLKIYSERGLIVVDIRADFFPHNSQLHLQTSPQAHNWAWNLALSTSYSPCSEILFLSHNQSCTLNNKNC